MNENYKDDMELKIMEAFTSMKSDQEIGMPDIEEELSKLLPKKSKRGMSNWRKIAASVAVIVTVCSIAVATIVNYRVSVSEQSKENVNENTITPEQKNAQAIPVDSSMTVSRIVAFDNAELCEIMDSINNIYKVNIVFTNEDVKHLHLHFRFYTSDKLNDVIHNLNMFEKINIKPKEGKIEVE